MINLPIYLKIECNIISNLAHILNEFCVKGKILLVSDIHLFEKFGSSVKTNLENNNFIISKYIISDSSITEAMKIAEVIISNDFSYIVGIGGGKVLDVCKYSGHISKKPFISVPTAVSNDGISSPISVLKLENGKVKSLGSTIPYALIIDLDVISHSPLELIQAGVGDTLSNFTALLDWQLADKKKIEKINDFAFLMSSLSLQMMLNYKYSNVTNIGFIRQLVQSLVISGIAMEIAGNSRPCSGSEHLLSHAIDYYCNKNNLHGLQVAFGTIVMSNLHNVEYQHLLKYINYFKISINPKSLKIKKDEFIYCMEKSVEMRPDRYTILSETIITNDLLNRLYFKLSNELL